MRFAALGILLVAGILGATLGTTLLKSSAFAQATPGKVLDASGQLIAFTADGEQGGQQITLIDPRTHVMSVYHIDRASGAISLRCVRNVRWDLQMDEFNGASPSPREIRSLLERR